MQVLQYKVVLGSGLRKLCSAKVPCASFVVQSRTVRGTRVYFFWWFQTCFRSVSIALLNFQPCCLNFRPLFRNFVGWNAKARGFRLCVSFVVSRPFFQCVSGVLSKRI